VALQPNLVLGAIGVAIALITGATVATNWRDLTGLRDWEASFQTDHADFPVRSVTLGAGAKRTEQYNVTHLNATTLHVDLTWQDPSFPQTSPDVTLRVLDPEKKVRGQGTHRGGRAGIAIDVVLVSAEDAPNGTHRFSARDDPHAVFDQRWPTSEKGHGIWTLEIANTGTGTQAGSIYYTLRVGYEYYAGTLREVATGASK